MKSSIKPTAIPIKRGTTDSRNTNELMTSDPWICYAHSDDRSRSLYSLWIEVRYKYGQHIKIMPNSNKLSEDLLLAVKMQKSTEELSLQLEKLPISELQKDLKTDNDKKAFWINCYNAFFQILRKEKGIDKPAIYRDKLTAIAGRNWSLDEMEHGILRKYRYKLSLGYLPNIFTPSLIKKMAVEKIDYRIHFALNCGAKSCPPIAFYNADRIEQQLEMATLSFLEGETDVFPDKKEIHVSRLFQWFAGDFGGKSGTRKILEEKLKLNTNGQKIIYKEYSWEEELDNYA